MAQARDGKMFSSRQAMLSHERKLPAAGGGMKKVDPLQMPGAGGGGDEMGGGSDPAQVVAEHGPANDVHVTHDHAANKHHVSSTHEDGHQDESDHGSVEEAHDHAKALAMPADDSQQQGDGTEGAEFE
jgi:hypothetical protein